MSKFQPVTPVPDYHFDIGDRVTIKQGHPPEYVGPDTDIIDIEIFEHWLESA